MINIIFIFIILFLILCIVYFKTNQKKELFLSPIYNEPILKKNIINTNIPIINIYKDETDISNKFNNILNVEKNINIENIKHFSYIEKKPYNLYYTDVNTFNNIYKNNYKALTLCTIPKSLLLISKRTNIDLTEGYLNIGYLNEPDKQLIQKIIKSQSNYVSMENYNFILTNNVIEDLFNINKIDIFVYFNTLTNPLFDEIKNNDFNLVSYNNYNKSLFNYYFPFYKRKIFTINKSTDSNIIHNTLQIDTIIFTTKEEEDFNINYLGILNYFGEFLKINYYLQYFDFTDISKKWSYKKQEEIKDILETFKDDSGNDEKSLLFIINSDVNNNEQIKFSKSQIISNDNIIVYKTNITKINNIPINENDRLLFTIKIKEFEINKIYYIVEVNETHIIIENEKKIELSDEKIYDNTNKIELLDETIKKYDLVFGESIYVLDYGSGIIVKKKNDENENENEHLVILLNDEIKLNKPNIIKNNPEIKLGGEYVNVTIREACVADQLAGETGSGYLNDIYDNDGENDEPDIYEIERNYNEKNIQEWDSRCIKDTECPFYLKNKNYPNTRGGCINGYCELPIGLKRISYKKYYEVINENNYPRCEGCDDDNIDCCDEQGADHDNFTGPNYIFSRNSDMTY
jgi:hypothetical protein